MNWIVQIAVVVGGAIGGCLIGNAIGRELKKRWLEGED